MGSEIEIVEERLKSFIALLRTEFGILDRIVYKNKNQHRRSSYFQYLLKVRRDLRLLNSANLEEILNSCFLVIYGKRPKQKVQLLESLKRRRCDGGKHNFLERLLGAAHLLSQMVEPMLKAAIEISTLLAQSFFMPFSLTVLALLARIRVLVQQILLDVVSTFNNVSSVSQKEQAIKINQEGLEVFREYYPVKDEPFVSLGCVWDKDKYVLVEKKNEGDEAKILARDIADDASVGVSSVQYQSVEVLLGGIESGKTEPNTAPEGPKMRNNSSSSLICPPPESNEEKWINKGSPTAGSPANSDMAPVGSMPMTSSSSSHTNPLKRKSDSQEKVAFVSVKLPAPSRGNKVDSSITAVDKVDGQREEDPFFSLLTGGNTKSSIF